MNVDLDMDFYHRAAAVQWLARCGERFRAEVDFRVERVESRTNALQSMFSSQWADATTVAQGCLTGHLAKTDYETYGSTWNRLVREAEALLERSIGERLSTVFHKQGWIVSLAETPLPEITPEVRASIGKQMADRLAAADWSGCLQAWLMGHATLAWLELTYRRRFRKAPVFFERLLEVYEAGHLPCGWEGGLDEWPHGKLLVH